MKLFRTSVLASMAGAFGGTRQSQTVRDVAAGGDAGSVTYGDGARDAGLTRERFKLAQLEETTQKDDKKQEPTRNKGGIDILV